MAGLRSARAARPLLSVGSCAPLLAGLRSRWLDAPGARGSARSFLAAACQGPHGCLLPLDGLQAARASSPPARLCASRRTSAESAAAPELDKRLLIMRKKMRHQARSRDDALLGDFLAGFAEAQGEALGMGDLEDWQQLMRCDDELLMNLIAGYEAPPVELDTQLLQMVRKYMASHGPQNPFKATW
uniref:Uncharacterized protein n=1 Tax=Alexandrium monilatum TaxID=311494 RepID=A0A7S4SYP6_9DINO